MKRQVVSTNDAAYFNSQMTDLSRNGFSVVVGTLHVSSHERNPTTDYEREQQRQGVRYIREFFFVEMEKQD